MHYSPDSGDVSGMEVWIVYGLKGYYAVVQVAEGMPQTPVVVAAEVDGSVIRFVYPSENMRFEGHVTNAGLVGTFGPGRVVLRRKKSYWQ